MRVKCRRRLPLKVALHIYPFELVIIISHREFINREYPLEDPKKTRPLFKRGMCSIFILILTPSSTNYIYFFFSSQLTWVKCPREPAQLRMKWLTVDNDICFVQMRQIHKRRTQVRTLYEYKPGVNLFDTHTSITSVSTISYGRFV